MGPGLTETAHRRRAAKQHPFLRNGPVTICAGAPPPPQTKSFWRPPGRTGTRIYPSSARRIGHSDRAGRDQCLRRAAATPVHRRALLKKPCILILDDSTSALDSITERRIFDTFYQKYRNTTVLLVAQRISSVQNADRIIVLDGRRICAVGTHAELLQNCGIYQAIYDSQQEGSEADGGRRQ